MNPFVREVVGSVVRWAATILVGILVSHGFLTIDQQEAWITGIVGGALTLGWSLWQKYRMRQKLLTALASHSGASEAHVESLVADGSAPPVSIPKNVPPYLPK